MRETNTQVWAGMGAAFLGIGGAVLAATSSASHVRGYHWYEDALVWVGFVAVGVGAYVFLKLFALPSLWLPSVKSQDALAVTFRAPRPSGTPDDIVIVRIDLSNDVRETFHDLMVNVLVTPPVLEMALADLSGSQQSGGQILDKPEGKVWSRAGMSLPGHRALAELWFRLRLPEGGPHSFGAAITIAGPEFARPVVRRARYVHDPKTGTQVDAV
jgi:hypothetical protein